MVILILGDLVIVAQGKWTAGGSDIADGSFYVEGDFTTTGCPPGWATTIVAEGYITFGGNAAAQGDTNEAPGLCPGVDMRIATGAQQRLCQHIAHRRSIQRDKAVLAQLGEAQLSARALHELLLAMQRRVGSIVDVDLVIDLG